MVTRKNNYFTLALLCMGYFIDFYDLTIMGGSYHEIIQQQFGITQLTEIQKTYLLISNFQTVGIFIGAILFGWLGDKVGRASAIKYSILLYSITTILAVYTHSLPLFILLRMLAYIGLSSEFSTSTVLILEMLPIKSASWGTATLYAFGVLGGITATLISFLSWKVTFLSGGIIGLILYLARGKISESAEYLYAKQSVHNKMGNIALLIKDRTYLLGLIKYLILILPFHAVISMMFIFPNYIVETMSVAYATKILLIGFFIGNLISCYLSAILNNYLESYKFSMFLMLIIFLALMLNFYHISEGHLMLYSIGLGLVGGGYPVTWAQQVGREYPTHIRSSASNLLFALGRMSGIIFNLLISAWLINKETFKNNATFTAALIFLLAIGSLALSKNAYTPRPGTALKPKS